MLFLKVLENEIERQIKLVKDGQVIEYDAKPSKETLTKFLNTFL